MDEDRTRVGSALELGAVLFAALAVTVPALAFGVSLEVTMDEGILVALAMAAFPPLFYRLRSPPTIGPRRAAMWGLGNAVVLFLLSTLVYVLVQRGGLTGIASEVAAFAVVAVLYFGTGILLDGHGLPDRSEPPAEPSRGE